MTYKDQCGIVRDLIPLVADNVASEESRKLVETHLSECAECKSVMNDARSEIKTGEVSEKDAKFIQLCLKMRRKLSWKRALMFFAALVAVVALLAGGITYIQYKMYVDWQAYRPQQYKVSVNKDGLLIFEYASDGQHGYIGYGYGFDAKDGAFYLTPHISSWAQIFSPVSASQVDAFTDIRMKDGKLVYVNTFENSDLVFNETSGRYQYDQTEEDTEITELRIGTPSDYQTAYRTGDTLPLSGFDAQNAPM